MMQQPQYNGGASENGTGDYSLQLSSFMPTHTDPNSPPPQLHIRLNLGNGNGHQLLQPQHHLPSQQQSGELPPMHTQPLYSASSADMTPLSPSLSRLLNYAPGSSPSAVDGSPAASSSPSAIDLDLADALSRLQQSELEFAAAFRSHGPGVTARLQADAERDPRNNIHVATLPINPITMLPITTQTIINASPKKLVVASSEEHKYDSGALTRAEQRIASASTPRSSFLSHSSSPLRSGASFSSDLLHPFRPSFSPRADITSVRGLFPPRIASIVASPGAAPSQRTLGDALRGQSTFASVLRPFADLDGVVGSSPSEEIAEMFRRSKASRGRKEGPDDKEDEMKTFGLWSIQRDSERRLANSLASIQAMPSLTEFVAQAATPSPSPASSPSASPSFFHSSPSQLTLTQAVSDLVPSSTLLAMPSHFSSAEPLSAPPTHRLDEIERKYDALRAEYDAQQQRLTEEKALEQNELDQRIGERRRKLEEMRDQDEREQAERQREASVRSSPRSSPRTSPTHSRKISHLSSISSQRQQPSPQVRPPQSQQQQQHHDQQHQQPNSQLLQQQQQPSQSPQPSSTQPQPQSQQQPQLQPQPQSHPQFQSHTTSTSAPRPSAAVETRPADISRDEGEAHLATIEAQLESLWRLASEQLPTQIKLFAHGQLALVEQRIRTPAFFHADEDESLLVLQELGQLQQLLTSAGQPPADSIAAASIAPVAASVSSVQSASASVASSPSIHSTHSAVETPSAVGTRPQVDSKPTSTRSTPYTSRPASTAGDEEYRYRIGQFKASRQLDQPQEPEPRSQPPQPQHQHVPLQPRAQPSSRTQSQSSRRSEDHQQPLQSQLRPHFVPSRAQTWSRERAPVSSETRSIRVPSVVFSERASVRSSPPSSIFGESELVPHSHTRHASAVTMSDAAELLCQESRFESASVVHIDEPTNEHAAEAVVVEPATAAGRAKANKTANSGGHLPLTSREVRALVRSEVLGTAAELRSSYAYLPPPIVPIQLTRTQMLQQALRARAKPDAKSRALAAALTRKANATAPIVRRNIEAMLEEEMKRRQGAWMEDADQDDDATNRDRSSPPSRSTGREVDRLLEHPSRLTQPTFSPSRNFLPPTNQHIDPLSFDRGSPTVPRTTVKQSLAPTSSASEHRSDLERMAAWSGALRVPSPERTSLGAATSGAPVSSPVLLTPLTSDAEIESHLHQLFASTRLELKPIEQRPSSRRASQVEIAQNDSVQDSSSHSRASAHEALEEYSSSFVSSGESTYSGDVSEHGLLDHAEMMRDLHHLSSSAITFQPIVSRDGRTSTHLELRPVGVILAPTDTTGATEYVF